MIEEQLKARAIELIRDRLDNDFFFQLVETGTPEKQAEEINDLIADATVVVTFRGEATKYVVQWRTRACW